MRGTWAGVVIFHSVGKYRCKRDQKGKKALHLSPRKNMMQERWSQALRFSLCPAPRRWGLTPALLGPGVLPLCLTWGAPSLVSCTETCCYPSVERREAFYSLAPVVSQNIIAPRFTSHSPLAQAQVLSFPFLHSNPELPSTEHFFMVVEAIGHICLRRASTAHALLRQLSDYTDLCRTINI